MAIVNGQYVPEPVGSTKDLQKQYFGSYTKKDMVDYTQAALQIKLKELENQFNLDIWNLQNEYNTPTAQMQRFQDAGLNPNLIYSQQNTAGDVKSASAAQPRSAGTFGKAAQIGLDAISQMVNVARSARETYDYINYGASMSKSQAQAAFYNSGILQNRANQEALETAWMNYLQGSPQADPQLAQTPRGQMYQYQLQSQEQTYERLKAMADLIPVQEARQRTLKELEDKRLSIMSGQNDFILDIHTGLGPGFDNFIKMLMYLTISRLQ